MKRKSHHPIQDFVSWSDRMERIMKKGLWLLAVLVLIFQTALQFPVVRTWLSETDKWEGVPFQRHVR